MTRTSNTVLPSATELWEILAKESPRFAVHYDYLKHNSNIFKPLKKVCQATGVNDEWIETYEADELTEIVSQINKSFDALEPHVLNQSNSLYEEVYDQLAISQPPTKADAIFVFGSSTNLRIQKAIELYHAKLADKLIVSGHGPFYANHAQNEAERMAKVAIQEGVPESDLILEPDAITIPDNVKRALDLFEETSFQPKKLLIVASPFALRRCVMDWYKFTPWDIEIIPVASGLISYDLGREGWTSTRRGVRVILNEYAKLILESKMDLLRRERQSVSL